MSRQLVGGDLPCLDIDFDGGVGEGGQALIEKLRSLFTASRTRLPIARRMEIGIALLVQLHERAVGFARCAVARCAVFFRLQTGLVLAVAEVVVARRVLRGVRGIAFVQIEFVGDYTGANERTDGVEHVAQQAFRQATCRTRAAITAAGFGLSQ
jgi:hypothetical protein